MYPLLEMDRPPVKIRTVFLRIFLPLALITLLVCGLLTRILYENELNLIRLHEQSLLERSAQSLQQNLQPPQDHLRSLITEAPVLYSLRNPADNLKAMEGSFASLLSRNKDYFQVRWIDETGQERLRLEPTQNSPYGYLRIKNVQLQNKSERYYFRATQALIGSNRLFLSPMDLNVEQGSIERPIRPTLRMSIPLQDRGENRGIIIINIDMRKNLSDLQQVLEPDTNRMQLISPQGYWLQHPDNKLEWGFQLPHGQTFKKQYPSIWQRMHSFSQNQWIQDQGLWSWAPVYPDNDPQIFNNQSMGWLLLEQSPEVINQLRLKFWGGALLLLLLTTAISGYILQRLLKAQQAQQQAESLALQNQMQADQLNKQREDEQRFRVIFNASHTPLLVCNSQGNITLVNPALEKLFGYSAFELSGLPIEHLIPVNMRKQHIKNRTNYLNHLRPRRKMMKNGESLQGVRKDGELINVEVGLSPYENKGETYILATLEDISSRIQSERMIAELHARKTRHLKKARKDAERLARLKTDFLANMSHEIRTPLNAILVLSELLDQELTEQQAFSENTRELSKNIQQAGENLLLIVNDILDYSRIEAGGLSLEETPFTLQDLFPQILSICRPQADKKDLMLQLDPDGNERLRLIGDPYRIRQVLLNLVSNAIKFTVQGSVSIRIHALKKEQNQISLQFNITDTGPGIEPEQQTAIFNAFTQADSSVTRKFGGTGLGLAISQQLLYMMGSQLELSSQLGKGSDFSFTLNLPLAEEAISEDFSEYTEPARPEASLCLEGLTLLVVDDSDLNRDLARRIIERAGGVTVLAENGADALSKAESMVETPPDLILMDLQMPVMSGYEAIKQLRQRPAYQQTPVIALTADITESAHKQALEHGADQVLTKPFTIHQIITCLKACLDGNNKTDSAPKDMQHQGATPLIQQASQVEQHPIMDEKAALLNWGDEESLQHFLAQFQRQYSHCCQEITEYLLANERKQAEGLAHKVKGAAGSLYLCALEYKLQQLEHKLREGSETNEMIREQILPTISDTLNNTLIFISSYSGK
ncbi:ATP-binding protein [Oceanospirillum sp.]|uniref:ATP-binding protein n=1 Tax=Oceanospirillum sp. TaxID=2021254 RepID=UPI003A947133